MESNLFVKSFTADGNNLTDVQFYGDWKLGIASGTGAITGVTQQLEEAKRQIAEMQAAITQKNTQIAGLNNTITSMNSQISDLNATITTERAQITTLSETIATKEVSIATLYIK